VEAKPFDDVEKNHSLLCQRTDRPSAGLLQDLKRRGLLEDTLVIWGGEFGRTPMIEQGKGRDHNPWGYTVWLAGGGVKGGIAHGSSTKNIVSFCIALVFSLRAPAASAGPNWPQFRGPGSSGVSDETGLPDRWSETENIAWKTPVPGRGWSSPIVWGERIFLTSAVSEGDEETPKKGLYLGGDRTRPPSPDHRWLVYCLEFQSGKILWERQAHQGKPESSHHLKNTFASETPVTDGERVYAYFGSLGLFAYDFDGALKWSKQFGSFKTRSGWGTAASPALAGGAVVIVNDNEEKSFIAAFDGKTGAELWRRDRDEKSNWATPLVWESGPRTEIITSGSGKVRSYDAKGGLLWELRGMSAITIPTPFAGAGLLYLSSGFVLDPHRPVYAIRPGASGDISLKENEASNSHIAWSQPAAAPYNPSPLIYGDYFYVLLDRGFLSCHEARTGKEVYSKQRLSPDAAAFTASPWAYEGKIFCLSEDGDAFILKAGPEFQVLRKNSLNEMCMATPAIARGSLFIRTLTRLYRIRKEP
jgi:outer membrane protein assembly factor BamB